MELSYLGILLIIASFVVGWFLSYIKSRFEIRRHKIELKDFQEHLNRQMKITGEGSRNLEADLEKLRKFKIHFKIS